MGIQSVYLSTGTVNRPRHDAGPECAIKIKKKGAF